MYLVYNVLRVIVMYIAKWNVQQVGLVRDCEYNINGLKVVEYTYTHSETSSQVHKVCFVYTHQADLKHQMDYFLTNAERLLKNRTKFVNCSLVESGRYVLDCTQLIRRFVMYLEKCDFARVELDTVLGYIRNVHPELPESNFDLSVYACDDFFTERTISCGDERNRELWELFA
ncbi:hypothetical protein EBS40_03875 [bacterium]|nr:hypothetical protein [bacterium]